MVSGFSADNLRIEDILKHYTDLTEAVHRYYDPSGPDYVNRFATEGEADVLARYAERLREVELSYSLTALASVEASFMVDYVIRCELKKKDAVSRALRPIYRRKSGRAIFIDDVLKTWNKHAVIPPRLLNDIIRAFELRNWLAHGRWWVLKIGKPTYDFISLYDLAAQVLMSFPLESV
jgi:hypothetical protein